MKIFALNDITLTSSTVAGSAYDEYDDEETYVIGNNVKVSLASDGVTAVFPVKEYMSLADANTDNYPPDDVINWIETGAENRCKMFDNYTNTQTTDTKDITVVLNANTFDAVGIFGIYGTGVTLKLIRNAVTIKEETFDLRTSIPASGWYSWLYNYYEYGITKILWEFPRYITGATLEITITDRVNLAKCGMVVMGNFKTLGATLYDAKVGIDDYSVKDTDSLGRTYLNQGAYANTADVTLYLRNTTIDYVHQQLASIRGLPAMFNLNNLTTEYQAMMIYGYVGNFDITIPGPVTSKCNLEVKGLI